jgi:hypothetical protein
LLAELLPRAPSEALVWRSAHGVMAVLLARRGARVIAADRDLLALAFAAKNAQRHEVSIEVRAAAWLPEIAARVPLVVAELSTSAGIDVAVAELDAARSRLAPRGQALLLSPEKLAKSVMARRPAIARPIATRGRWTVLRVS